MVYTYTYCYSELEDLVDKQLSVDETMRKFLSRNPDTVYRTMVKIGEDVFFFLLEIEGPQNLWRDVTNNTSQ